MALSTVAMLIAFGGWPPPVGGAIFQKVIDLAEVLTRATVPVGDSATTRSADPWHITSVICALAESASELVITIQRSFDLSLGNASSE